MKERTQERKEAAILNKLTEESIRLGVRAQEVIRKEEEKNRPTELKIIEGKFVDNEGRKVRAEVLGVGMIHAGFGEVKELIPIHRHVKIPEGTNAFVIGNVFDNNSGGSWTALPDYVAPAIFLRKK